MGSLHIDMDAADADAFVMGNPGFETAPGAHVTEAIYGDTSMDRNEGDDDAPLAKTPPRRPGLANPAPAIEEPAMPRPWPGVIGYDGMPPTFAAGVAMKAENGQWVPVARFDPPLSPEDQAKSNARALEAYADRCAEYSVKGAVGDVLAPQWEA